MVGNGGDALSLRDIHPPPRFRPNSPLPAARSGEAPDHGRGSARPGAMAGPDRLRWNRPCGVTPGGRPWDNGPMTRSELIGRIAHKQPLLAGGEVELAVKVMLEHMTASLAAGGRIEIRGFGSFALRFRRGRVGHNPKTGTPVALRPKYVPYFKPGKALRGRVDRLTGEAHGDPGGGE